MKLPTKRERARMVKHARKVLDASVTLYVAAARMAGLSEDEIEESVAAAVEVGLCAYPVPTPMRTAAAPTLSSVASRPAKNARRPSSCSLALSTSR